MKVAALEWHGSELLGALPFVSPERLIQTLRDGLQMLRNRGIELVVLPGFMGVMYLYAKYPQLTLAELAEVADPEELLNELRKFSREMSLAICPGSYWRREHGKMISATCLIVNGDICGEQTQLYLARWESDLGLDCGCHQQVITYDSWKIGMVVGTDVFYPQVSRALAMEGVNLVLAPIGFVGEPNRWQQLSGMWNHVQQNQFFAIESGFNGRIANMTFWGESAINAPVEMTPKENGFMCRTGFLDRFRKTRPDPEEPIPEPIVVSPEMVVIDAELNEAERRRAIAQFDVLHQLNPELYRRMRLFEGK